MYDDSCHVIASLQRCVTYHAVRSMQVPESLHCLLSVIHIYWNGVRSLPAVGLDLGARAERARAGRQQRLRAACYLAVFAISSTYGA
jgi:hypothetical protein